MLNEKYILHTAAKIILKQITSCHSFSLKQSIPTTSRIKFKRLAWPTRPYFLLTPAHLTVPTLLFIHWVLPALLFYLFLCCTRFPPAFVFAVSSSPRSSQRLPFCHSHLSLNVPSQERPRQLHPQLLSTVSLCLIFVTVLLPT